MMKGLHVNSRISFNIIHKHSTVMYIFILLLSSFTIIDMSIAIKYDDTPKMLVVSYDAFRYDYFDRNVTPYMNELKKKGSYSDYMMNVFVTKTYPNHHTIATGLYAETHGVIDNQYYDIKLNKTITTSETLFNYNNITPIWTINQLSGKHSGVMMWPGCSVKYNNTLPTFVQEWNTSINMKDRVDRIISWFTHPTTPINFGMLYIEEPDNLGHVVGINSPLFNDMLRKLDNITKYLHEKLEENGLKDIVNIIHLSDHGMANVAYDKIIDITKYINQSDYILSGTAPNLQIYPKPGKEETIYNKLKHAADQTNKFEVYRKEDIPKRFHYSNNIRIGPILLMAKLGYTFQTLYDSIKYYEKQYNFTATDKSEFGVHGYDNEFKEMHPMFFASGPAFLPECKIETFNNLDLFPLFCKILELQCPPNNGSLDKLKDCLTSFSNNERLFTFSIPIYIGIALSALVLMATAIVYKRRQKAKVEYRKVLNIYEIENCWDEKYDYEYVSH